MSKSIMSNVFQQINYMEEVGYQMLAANFEDVIEENSSDIYYEWIREVKENINQNYNDFLQNKPVKIYSE